MASQEFLASFAVEIDEGGVSRLQQVLSDNRDLANEVSAAFEAATAAIQEYQKAALGGDNPSGEGNRDNGSPMGTGNAGNVTESRESGSGAGVPGANRDGFWVSDNPMQDLTRLQLSGVLEGENAPAMPSTARELTLRNLETMFLGQASRDTGNASKELVGWQDIGLSSNPADRKGYSELVDAAQDLLREPMQQARDYMKQAMEAEEAGLDGTEYVQMVDEVLRKPLEQVKEMVDNFDFGDEGGSREGDASGSDGGTSGALDLEGARAEMAAFREEAAQPVSMSGNASGIVSAASSAYASVKSMFSTPITIRAKVEKEGGEDGGETGGALKMSVGGRFSKPTDVQVAEDGDAEYIIPVKKENRAVPLLKQLLSELSPSARASLSLGNGASSLISGGISAGQPAGAQITQNNSNVSAPVTIQVRSSGANPEQIGQKLYDTAERYLLRTLQDAMA